MPESVVEELIKPVYAAYPDVPITILAAPGEVQLHFAARGRAGGGGRRSSTGSRRTFQNGPRGRDLRPRRRDTGGGRRRPPAARQTDARAGGVLHGRPARRAPHGRRRLVGLLPRLGRDVRELGEGGSRRRVRRRRSSASARSRRRPPARWRSARGVRFGASIGLSVTGIAGPGGGTPEKPVGTVHYALDDADGTRLHHRLLLPGDRALVRRWTTSAALSMLRHHLLGTTGWRP